MRHGPNPGRGGNTVIGIVATNARLDRVQTNKLAALGSLGVARTISPVNTMADGDITFAISLGKERATVDRGRSRGGRSYGDGGFARREVRKNGGRSTWAGWLEQFHD